MFVQKKDFKMRKMFQKCPFFKGFKGRIVKGEGYKINIKRYNRVPYWIDWHIV